MITKSVNLVVLSFAAFFFLSCDYGFDLEVYLKEGLDTDQSDFGPSEMIEISLETSEGSPITLVPPFSPGISDYSAQISRTEPSLTLIWNSRDPGARVYFNGDTPVSTSGQREILLDQENIILTFRLRGSNLTQKDYTLTIAKAQALSSNSFLKSLSLGSYVLEPAFTPEILEYTVRVPEGTKRANLEDILSFENGDKTQKIALFFPLTDSPPMTFRIQVTAEDQSVSTYKLNIINGP